VVEQPVLGNSPAGAIQVHRGRVVRLGEGVVGGWSESSAFGRFPGPPGIRRGFLIVELGQADITSGVTCDPRVLARNPSSTAMASMRRCFSSSRGRNLRFVLGPDGVELLGVGALMMPLAELR